MNFGEPQLRLSYWRLGCAPKKLASAQIGLETLLRAARMATAVADFVFDLRHFGTNVVHSLAKSKAAPAHIIE